MRTRLRFTHQVMAISSLPSALYALLSFKDSDMSHPNLLIFYFHVGRNRQTIQAAKRQIMLFVCVCESVRLAHLK